MSLTKARNALVWRAVAAVSVRWLDAIFVPHGEQVNLHEQ